MGVTDDGISRIIELIAIDGKMVLETAQERPVAAWDLACQSWKTRLPLVEWLVNYKHDKALLAGSEFFLNSTFLRRLAPAAASDMSWQRSKIEARLAQRRVQLRNALHGLRNPLQERLLTAVHKDPALIPVMSRGLLRSGIYHLRWQAHKYMIWRSRETIESERNNLVEKWLEVLVVLHRRMNPLGPMQPFSSAGNSFLETHDDAKRYMLSSGSGTSRNQPKLAHKRRPLQKLFRLGMTSLRPLRFGFWHARATIICIRLGVLRLVKTARLARLARVPKLALVPRCVHMDRWCWSIRRSMRRCLIRLPYVAFGVSEA